MSRQAIVTSAAPEFVYVVGDSHVRSFSNDPGFIPLYIGSGKQVRWTDDQKASVATLRLGLNFARLPVEAPVILVFGEPDVRFTLSDSERARADADSVNAKLGACVARRMEATNPFLTARSGFSAIYGCVPGRDPATNRFVRSYNEFLAAACGRFRIPFIELATRSICEPDGGVRPEFMTDEIHLSSKIVPVVRDALQRFGVEPAARASDFAWSDFLRFRVGDADTRIWGDAALDSGSVSYAASELRRQGAAIVTALADLVGAQGLLVINAREGHVPLALDFRPGRLIFALESSVIRRRLMRSVLAVAQRGDVHILQPNSQTQSLPEIVVEFYGDADAVDSRARAAARGARFLFLMPTMSRSVSSVLAADFPFAGTIPVSVQTKSGAHRGDLWFGCRTPEDRALVCNAAPRSFSPVAQ